VTVQDGDCLWTIASEILDSDDAPRIDAYWRAIFETPITWFPGRS
jgi:hypothetical protein